MATIQQLPEQAEKIPGLYLAMVIIIGIAFLGTLGAGVYWEFTESAEVPAWLISVASATGGGLLGALLPKGAKPIVLVEQKET